MLAPRVVRRSPAQGVAVARRRAERSQPGASVVAAGRDAERLATRRTAALDAEQLVRSRTASLSRAAERSGRFSSGDVPGAQTLTAAEEVHLSRQLRRGQAAESVRRELSETASDAEWAFCCGLPSAAALRLVLSQAQTARSLLLARNVGLVKLAARRFNKSLGNMRREDLVTDGMLGLMTAIEQFDPERGYRFSTFAYTRVEAAQRRAIQNGRTALRVPVWLQEVQAKLLKARTAFAADGVLQPTDEELAGATNTPLAHVQAVAAAFARQEASFDVVAQLESDLTSAAHGTEDSPEPGAGAAWETEAQADADPWAMASLARFERLLGDDDVQRSVLRAFYGLDGDAPQNPRVLAQRLGLTPAAVTKLVRNGLEKMSAA